MLLSRDDLDDGHVERAGHRADLDALREDIRAFNEVLRAAGLPEIYLGGPRPIT